MAAESDRDRERKAGVGARFRCRGSAVLVAIRILLHPTAAADSGCGCETTFPGALSGRLENVFSILINRTKHCAGGRAFGAGEMRWAKGVWTPAQQRWLGANSVGSKDGLVGEAPIPRARHSRTLPGNGNRQTVETSRRCGLLVLRGRFRCLRCIRLRDRLCLSGPWFFGARIVRSP